MTSEERAPQLFPGGVCVIAWRTSRADEVTTRQTNNILFIMCDQLRWDYLSCYGHGIPSSPRRASMVSPRGVRFTCACAVAHRHVR